MHQHGTGDGHLRGANEHVLKQLRTYLETLGNRYLRDGQTLRIDIRDIDLAGRYEPWQTHAHSVRFMHDKRPCSTTGSAIW